MGKSAILLAIVSIYSWTMTSSSQNSILLELEDEQAFYEEKVLAREQALSGFNMVVSKTQNDFMSYRIDLESSLYGDGEFSISAVTGPDNTVQVTATGRVGRAQYTIVGDMTSVSGAKLAALNIDGPVSNARGIGGSYRINGVNTNPDDSEPGGPNAFGVYSTLLQAHVEMQDGLREDLVTGGEYGDPGSFAYEGQDGLFTDPDDVPDFDALSSSILGLCEAAEPSEADDFTPNPACDFYSGNQVFAGNEVFGDPSHPTILIVDGNATFRGSIQGYGILYVKGNFKTEVGEPRWEGLIFASTQGGTHELRGMPHIYGAVVLRSEDPDPDLDKSVYDPLSFIVRGEPTFHYSQMALDEYVAKPFNILMDFVSAGTGGIELRNIRQAAGASQMNN
ncbi:MAG: hypothetical protein IH853_08105 [Bacteroidetes bacterium]|nr:hypothetical protein [Bacteroidota bacterium]